jgi:hypothetical protein
MEASQAAKNRRRIDIQSDDTNRKPGQTAA